MKRPKHLYKRFFSLFIGQSFFVRRARLAVKVGPFSYKELFGTDPQPVKRIAPWTKVRTLIPVLTKWKGRQILVENHNVQSTRCIWQETTVTGCPAGAVRVDNQEHLDKILAEANSGKTHYVGDDCPGGHQRDPMVQDHTPDQVPTHERNGPAS